LSPGDRDLLDWLMQHGVDIILTMTKIDKISRQQAGIRAKRIWNAFEMEGVTGPVLFSSKTRQGRDELRACINTITGVKI
jgi:GTP-binding protein